MIVKKIGFRKNFYAGKCYQLSRTKASYAEAEKVCRSRNGDLASVDSRALWWLILENGKVGFIPSMLPDYGYESIWINARSNPEAAGMEVVNTPEKCDPRVNPELLGYLINGALNKGIVAPQWNLADKQAEHYFACEFDAASGDEFMLAKKDMK